jgi:DNA modification methylase
MSKATTLCPKCGESKHRGLCLNEPDNPAGDIVTEPFPEIIFKQGLTENCPECKIHRGHRATCSIGRGLENVNADELYSLENYHKFLRAKCNLPADFGVPVEPGEVFELADKDFIPKPHQTAGVMWAVKGGRRALFESFGLGKTVQQLEIVRLILKAVGGWGLIVCPLGVRQEFMRDAARLGITVKFVRRTEDLDRTGINLTNYESIREGKLDPAGAKVPSLDEAAIFRGFGGVKTYREFMRLFENVPYRFVATATPDPNEYIELLAYAAFLGIMDVSQAKTRFFKRDSVHADKLTLHPHKVKEYFLWVASWALFVNLPSDLGFDDSGYALPDLEVIKHEVAVDHAGAEPEKSGQGRMFREASHGVTDAAREKRNTLVERVQRMVEIIHALRRPEAEKRLSETVCQNILPGAQGGVLATPADGRAQGVYEGVLPEILSSQQTPIPTSGTGMVSPKQGETQTGGGSLEGKESRKGRPLSGGEAQRSSGAGEGESAQCGLVPGEQATGEQNRPQSEVATVRPNSNGIRCDAGKPRKRLRDLQASSGEAIERGSRSSDRGGKGIAMPGLQLGTGAVPGRSGDLGPGNQIPEQFIVWCDLNDEQRAIDKALDQMGITCSSLYGNQDLEDRDAALEEWRAGNTTAFVTKPMMYGAGVNLQQCNMAIFIGIGFKFSAFLQAVKRIHRFLQTRTVRIHLIYAESERLILQNLMNKWERHKVQAARMSEIIREYGLSQAAMSNALARSMGVDRVEVKTETATLVNNDSVEELETMPANSVDLVLTSCPFSTQYEYSPSYNDFGHTDGNEHFFEQMDFMTHRLFKVMKPGRLAAIHVKDRIVPGGITGLGFQTVYPFHCRTIDHFVKHGFGYLGMVTVVTDVVRENNQTYRLGWTEQCKDGTKMGKGMPEYLLYFRKPPTDTTRAYADSPVVKHKPRCIDEETGEEGPYDKDNKKQSIILNSGYSRARWQIDAHGFWRSSGERLLTADELLGIAHHAIYKKFRAYSKSQVYNHEHHVALAEALEQKKILPVKFMLLPPQSWHEDVWTDITRMRTLNGAQSAKGREMHLCPMQFDIANRVINQHSEPGETVLDPFGGLMTVPYCAVPLKRKSISIELSPSYFKDGITYVKAAEEKLAMPTLFDVSEWTDNLEKEFADDTVPEEALAD